MFFILIPIVLAVIVFFWLSGMYNNMVSLRNQVPNSFAQISIQLKRRYDLIPNLVETAKAYMKHERETLEAVIAARNSAYKASEAAATNPNAGNLQALSQSEAMLGGAMSRLMVVAEQYPELKANQNMMQLTEELTSTENRITFARQNYNDTATSYNTMLQVFPQNIFTGMFHFQPSALLDIPDKVEIEKPVRVAF